MMNITTEVFERKRGQGGRKFTTAGERTALIEAYRTSGLTQRVFAQREGVKYSTFTAWLQGRRRAGEAVRATSRATPVRFAEVTVDAARGAGFALEAVLADGTILRGAEPAALAALLRAVRS